MEPTAWTQERKRCDNFCNTGQVLPICSSSNAEPEAALPFPIQKRGREREVCFGRVSTCGFQGCWPHVGVSGMPVLYPT